MRLSTLVIFLSESPTIFTLFLASYLGISKRVPREQNITLVQQVVELAAVNFIERYPHAQLFELVDLPEYILGGDQVQPSHAAPVAQHRVCFPAACLSIGEARDPGAVEGACNEGPYRIEIDLG